MVQNLSVVVVVVEKQNLAILHIFAAPDREYPLYLVVLFKKILHFCTFTTIQDHLHQIVNTPYTV